jgi:hypothetical protein
LGGIRDHTGGPARSASIQPISNVALVLLPFYPFSCAVVRRKAHDSLVAKSKIVLSSSFTSWEIKRET